MFLLANGCSHTAGAEIEYPRQPRCYHKAWPKHLADLFNCEHENLSNSEHHVIELYALQLDLY